MQKIGEFWDTWKEAGNAVDVVFEEVFVAGGEDLGVGFLEDFDFDFKNEFCEDFPVWGEASLAGIEFLKGCTIE